MTPEWFAKKCGTCQLHTAQKLNWTWRIGVKRIEVNVYSCIEFESQVWARKELEKAAAQTRSGALTTLTIEVIWWHCSTVFRQEVIHVYQIISDIIIILYYHTIQVWHQNLSFSPKPTVLEQSFLDWQPRYGTCVGWTSGWGNGIHRDQDHFQQSTTHGQPWLWGLIASIEDCLGCLGRFSPHRRALMSAP